LLTKARCSVARHYPQVYRLGSVRGYPETIALLEVLYFDASALGQVLNSLSRQNDPAALILNHFAETKDDIWHISRRYLLIDP